MYFESVFIKPNNFYISIYNVKKNWQNNFFLASKVGRPLNKFNKFNKFNFLTHQSHIHVMNIHFHDIWAHQPWIVP